MQSLKFLDQLDKTGDFVRISTSTTDYQPRSIDMSQAMRAMTFVPS